MRAVLVLSLVLSLVLAAGVPTSPPDPVQTLAAAGTRRADLHGISVVYQGIGAPSGAPVVLVHGRSCDHTHWKLVVPELSRSRHVIAIDLPGHGQSDKPELAYSMTLFADAVAAVLADAGVPRATIIGHSMGAAVARTLALRHPERVSALVAVDGRLRKFQDGGASMEPLLKELRGPGYRAFMQRMFAGMTGAGMRTTSWESSRRARRGSLRSSLPLVAEPVHALLSVFSYQEEFSRAFEREQIDARPMERARPANRQLVHAIDDLEERRCVRNDVPRNHVLIGFPKQAARLIADREHFADEVQRLPQRDADGRQEGLRRHWVAEAQRGRDRRALQGLDGGAELHWYEAHGIGRCELKIPQGVPVARGRWSSEAGVAPGHR